VNNPEVKAQISASMDSFVLPPDGIARAIAFAIVKGVIDLAETGRTNGRELWRDGPLAFMNDLDIVAVRIEHPCRVITWIVFGPNLR
jgi:hypothetical protein